MDRERVFQLEVTAQIHALGEKAVAALIETRKDPSGAVRHYAVAQQEALQKKLPGEAVQTKSNQVLADVLRAYGLVRDMEAINVILSFVNSDRAQVRVAAREALAAFGQDGIWKLREAYTNLLGKSPPDQWAADQVARELFLAYDRFRLQEVYALLEEGLQKQKAGNMEEATAAFDKVLARQPTLDRRAEMVPAYVGLAQRIEDNDRTRALALFRKALRLDPEGPRVTQIQSEIAYLDGMDLLSRGIADADAFRRALALDGGNAKARAELDRLESAVQVREERTRRWAAGGAVLALALAAIVLFGGPRRRAARA
jgi:tetratricopeptide (TPR) repeat protein